MRANTCSSPIAVSAQPYAQRGAEAHASTPTESFAARLTAFDIAADGNLSNRRIWADLEQSGDGMRLDAEGVIWPPALVSTWTRCSARVRAGY